MEHSLTLLSHILCFQLVCVQAAMRDSLLDGLLHFCLVCFTMRLLHSERPCDILYCRAVALCWYSVRSSGWDAGALGQWVHVERNLWVSIEPTAACPWKVQCRLYCYWWDERLASGRALSAWSSVFARETCSWTIFPSYTRLQQYSSTDCEYVSNGSKVGKSLATDKYSWSSEDC